MENFNFNTPTTILLFAALQGFILAFMLVASKKYRKKSNIALATAIASSSMVILGNLINILSITVIFPFFQSTFLIGIGIYFFVKFLIEPEDQISKSEYYLFLPVIFQIVIFIFIAGNCLIDPNFISDNITSYYTYRNIEEIFCLAFFISVSVLAFKKIIYYQGKLFNNYTNIENKDLNWLRILFLIIFVLWFIWLVSFIYATQYKLDYKMYPLWLGMAAINYAVGYVIYLRREVFEVAIFTKEPETPNKENLLSDKTKEHYARLLQLMETEKPYQNQELNMTILADKMELSNGYLSQIINQNEGKNFFDFINHYRVEDVKSKLRDPNYGHYSILGIGLEAGFKSKSTFNASFKKITGKTPSGFKKSIQSS